MSNSNGTLTGQAEPQLTPIEEWQRLRLHGAVKTLESTGRVVRWRPVNLTRMLKEGEIPEHLTAFVAEMLWAGTEDDARSNKEKAIDWQDYLHLVAKASLLHPVVADDAQGQGEISPDDLVHAELLEIERMARNPVDEVRRFRAEQGGDVDARPEGDEVQQTA